MSHFAINQVASIMHLVSKPDLLLRVRVEFIHGLYRRDGEVGVGPGLVDVEEAARPNRTCKHKGAPFKRPKRTHHCFGQLKTVFHDEPVLQRRCAHLPDCPCKVRHVYCQATKRSW